MAGSSLALRPLWARSATSCAATRLKLGGATPSAVKRLTAPLLVAGRRPVGLSARAPAITQGCWLAAQRGCATGSTGEVPRPPAAPPLPPAPPTQETSATSSTDTKFYRERLLDGEEEVLTEAEKLEKDKIVAELTKRLSGPLADEHGNVPTGADRPIAIEVDGPSHFYANSKRYTAYTKLKHRLLTRMGYKVLHVPYFEWRRLRGAKEREDYMRSKLLEEPSEWLDPEDEKYFNSPPEDGEEEFSVKPSQSKPAPPTPPPPHSAARPAQRAASAPPMSPASEAPATPGPPPRPPAPPAGTAQPSRPPHRSGSPPPPPPRRQPGDRPPVLSGLHDAGAPRGVPRPPPPQKPRPQTTDNPEVIGFPPFPSSK